MKRVLLVAILSLSLYAALSPLKATASWVKPLEKAIEKIDLETDGQLGVFVKKPSENASLNYQSDRPWYLASTTKIPVAIAVLLNVEAGKISLDQNLTVTAKDHVDGSGEVRFKKAGTPVSVRYLLEKMITQSDSTATDMLILLIGESELNRLIKEKMASQGFGPITTLLQVRYDAYSELHPNAKNLSNYDFIRIKQIKGERQKLQFLAKKMKVKVSEFKTQSIPEAFERYYKRGSNSATLSAYGSLLERLIKGEILSPVNTDLLLELMEKVTTGKNRIKAGLIEDARFAHKTGTQIGRVCNMGIIRTDKSKKTDILIVAACAEKFKTFRAGEGMLAQLGEALARFALPSDAAPAAQGLKH